MHVASGFRESSKALHGELVPSRNVSLLERGRINITVNTARQIAHVLEISLSELFRGLS
jgi:transcriptional regulator with XRE-family HTH domain